MNELLLTDEFLSGVERKATRILLSFNELKLQRETDSQIVVVEMEPLGLRQELTANSRILDVGTLRFSGIDFLPVARSVGRLVFSGLGRTNRRDRSLQLEVGEQLPRGTKVALIRVRSLDGGLNPFDHRAVKLAIEEAQTQTQTNTPAAAPAAPPAAFTALTVLNGLPFHEAAGAGPVDGILGLAVNGAGDSISIVDGGPPPPGFSINLAFGGAGAFVATDGVGFNLVSTIPADPVFVGVATSVTMQRVADGNFFRVNFTLDLINPMIISSLAAFDCGTNVANCP